MSPPSRPVALTFCWLLILSTVLAGCLHETEDLESTDDADDGNGEGNDNGNNTTEPPGNETEDPDEEDEGENETASKDDPNANLLAGNLTGDAPLSVTFSLEGSVDENRSLTWTLDFGDGLDPEEGDTLPTTRKHEYTEAGEYDALFTVSDGEDTAQDNVTITVEEGETEPEPDAVININDDPAPAYQDAETGLPVTVTAGNTVEWVWEGALDHSVTSLTDDFDSGIKAPGSTWTHTFDDPGVYAYSCDVHPGQLGVVVVAAA